MPIYTYKDGKYTHEFVIGADEKVFVSETPIDCTKFTPDENGTPVEIVVEEPIYVEPETSEVFTAANDAIYGNDIGNDTLFANIAE